MKIVLVWVLMFTSALAVAEGVYLDREDFLNQAFNGIKPEPHTIWLKDDIRQDVLAISQGSLRKLRVQYWSRGQRTAWILDEIGKELPITIGVVVENDEIRQLHVLAFRESRGGEIRFPFFTKQFSSLSLTDEYYLDDSIDGITGATLSVRAVKKVARLALYLHARSKELQEPHKAIAKF